MMEISNIKYQISNIRYKYGIIFALLVTGCWLLVTGSCYAEEKEPLVCNGDRVEYFQDEKKIMGEGNVSINYKDIRITCNKIEVFTETKDAVAYGDVKLYQDNTVFQGEKVYYNFNTKKGQVIDVRVEGMGPWFGRGESAEKFDEKRSRIKNGYITTCDQEKPHYRIKSNRIDVFFDDKIVARNVVFEVGNIPLFYMPYCSYSMKGKYPSFVFIPGHSRKWGFYMLTAWKYELQEAGSDAMFSLPPGKLHLDYREKKGFAHGIDQDYFVKGLGQGRFRYYYMEERDKEKASELRTETQRYRVQLKHRWQATDNTLAMLEYHKMSDIDFLKDYYYREEYEKENQPRSYLSVVSAFENYTLSALVQKRTNSFFTETERLPEIKLDLKSQRIKDTSFYYKSDFSAANLNNKIAYSDVDEDTRRLDTYNQLSYVTKLGFLSVTPYTGVRQTYYSDDKFGNEDQVRGIFYSGLDLSTKFYKIYDVTTNMWNLDINKIRHIITPTINYKYIHNPTISSSKFSTFDSIDSIVRDNTVTVGIENKFQTKRKEKEEFNTSDLGMFLFTGDYNFKPEAAGSQWSNFKFDMELTPYNWLRFESDATYEPASRDFKTVNFDLVTSNKDLWSFGLGSRYEQNSIHELTSQFTFSPSPKWQIRTYGRYDFKKVIDASSKRTNDFVEQEYALVRDLHCWTGEFALNIKDGYSFWVIFRLKAFPEVPFKFSSSYRGPKSTP